MTEPSTGASNDASSDLHEVFTEPWVGAWAAEIRGSDAYRQAAATWEGSVALAMSIPSDAERGVFLNLWHGECRDARVASDADLEQADFVLAADLDVWRRVLARDLDPIMGLMTGKLKLRRGSLAKLTPQMNASKEMVLAATRIATTFPGD